MGSRMKGLEFGAVIWSCVLLLLPLPSGSVQPSCPIETVRTELQSPNLTASQLTFNSAFISPIVNSFLSSVQPNPFPKDLVVRMIQDKSVITQGDTVKEVLRYEIGFLVCVAIGILYIVLMPLTGLIFACCRCCGNCGGRMYQEQKARIHCKRKSFYWSTFFITTLIMAGNVCMFLGSTYTSETVMHSSSEVNNILEHLKGYLASVPKQIQQVMDESSKTMDKVKYNLNEIGPLLGKLIQNGLEGPLNPALNSITEIAQVINSTSVGLLQFNKTLEQLKPKVDELTVNLSALSQRINTTLHKSDCVNCTSLQPELDKLSVDVNLDFPDQNDLRSAVNKAENADVIGQANKGRDFTDSIPQKVRNETRQSVQMALLELEKLKIQISGISKDLPLDALKNISGPLTDVQESISNYSPQFELSSKISRAVGLILSCLILLVVVCNLLGLLLGPVGLQPKDNPTERSCTSNCGGIFFMIGVAFSFLVSWIFMIVVLILFVVGGNTYSLVCKPWENNELIKIVDTPGLIQGFDLASTLNLKTNLTIVNVYNDCKMNKPLWTTLHLNELIDLNSILNISQYTGQIYQTFDKTQINIANITILTPEIKSQLRNFSGSASTMNFSSIMQQITNVSETNLNLVAETLDVLASEQSNQNITNELRGEARDLRDLQTGITSTIMPLLLELNSTIKNLSGIAAQINATVENVLMKVGYAQDVLNYNISQIVKSMSRTFIDCQLEIFLAYIQWANQTITEKVGRCGTAADAVERSAKLICTHFVAALNSFWFSLGWCMLFLIPSIIFSVKLAKFYRKMKYADVYENNHIMMNPFPRAQLKSPTMENGKQPTYLYN
ncbi:prominin-1-A-like [Myxocyprinus asiaticus]|uniref:prominin-1-A-like n=1 Tax=Myxocyprinus asiaticus TaxID=70543 RepID=UPI002221556F|nr:prominin-1-A-like [Myxocyprinus asiaticus]